MVKKGLYVKSFKKKSSFSKFPFILSILTKYLLKKSIYIKGKNMF